jgi:small subunit ribosomal protein S21
MVEVRVKQDEPLSRALNRFMNQCRKAGIQKEIKRRQRYEKPSERRRRKKQDFKRKKR